MQNAAHAAQSPATSTPFVVHREVTDGGLLLRLEGDFSVSRAPGVWTQLDEAIAGAQSGLVRFELSGVGQVDANAMALLAEIREVLLERGVRSEVAGAQPRLEELLALFQEPDFDTKKPGRSKFAKRRAEGVVSHIGRAAVAMGHEAKAVVAFFGSIVVAFVNLVRNPRSGNWREVPVIMERAGADAVPIVLLINFLIGFVMGFQGANQLKKYGANLWVADLVGLSVTRELAPLMTAIVLAGRTGAAFTAELGSMKVAEEIDALRTMGLAPMRYLVLPRVLGLLLVMPLLVVMGDAIGIFGGMLVGAIDLGVTPRAYFTETLIAVHTWDVVSGLLKSVGFALAIGLIACQQGFATVGGAEGVGRRTTTAVVSTLFCLIVIDAVYTVVYRAFNL